MCQMFPELHEDSNHEIYETWRADDPEAMSAEERAKYDADAAISRRIYNKAFTKTLRHTTEHEWTSLFVGFEETMKQQALELFLTALATHGDFDELFDLRESLSSMGSYREHESAEGAEGAESKRSTSSRFLKKSRPSKKSKSKDQRVSQNMAFPASMGMASAGFEVSNPCTGFSSMSNPMHNSPMPLPRSRMSNPMHNSPMPLPRSRPASNSIIANDSPIMQDGKTRTASSGDMWRSARTGSEVTVKEHHAHNSLSSMVHDAEAEAARVLHAAGAAASHSIQGLKQKLHHQQHRHEHKEAQVAPKQENHEQSAVL
jgi:hypothetical protein